MIHDYFILLSFLSLGILIVSDSSYLKSGKYLSKVTKEDHNSLRFRRKARIWRNIMLIFVIVLLSSRLGMFLVGPSELISKGFSSQESDERTTLPLGARMMTDFIQTMICTVKLLLQDFSCDDHPVDLGGPLIDTGHPGVSVVTFDRIGLGGPITTMDLNGHIRYFA